MTGTVALVAASLLGADDATVIRVVDHTGKPVAGATVYVDTSDPCTEPYDFTGTTDLDGIVRANLFFPEPKHPKSWPRTQPGLWRFYFEAWKQPGPETATRSVEERKWAFPEDYPRRVTIVLAPMDDIILRNYALDKANPFP